MIIKELSIRNFKSFGNNEQIIKLENDCGQLILLSGGNANGKSSLLESFEYCLYGKVKSNKNKKWTKLSSLPNRINKELLNKISFISNSSEINIERGISPNVLRLYENGIENDRAGKSNIDKIIEDYVGMDIETFKSFISLSINDFKNFISLTTEEKQLLLDKLFNLEVINTLNGILKSINANNKKLIVKYDSEIDAYENSIENIRVSIKRAIIKQNENNQQEIEDIKLEINSKKDEFASLKEKVEKIKEKESLLKREMDKEKEEYISVKSSINTVQKEIDLYDMGKCPTCATEFTGDVFDSMRSTLIEKKNKINDIKEEIENNIKSIKEKQDRLLKISNETNSLFNEMQYLLRSLKSKLDSLSKTSEIKNESIEEFEKSIQNIQLEQKKSEDLFLESKDKEVYYKELSKVLGEDGVKKSIISSIIKPINKLIQQNITIIGLPYEVILDETFTASIMLMGEEVEQDQLSTGENKMLNLSIALAYIGLIRTKKYINILFLDEVFASIDLDNIDKILLLLKNFANEYKINIFVVHHAVLKEEMFDRIIRVNKGIFSSITDSKMN